MAIGKRRGKIGMLEGGDATRMWQSIAVKLSRTLGHYSSDHRQSWRRIGMPVAAGRPGPKCLSPASASYLVLLLNNALLFAAARDHRSLLAAIETGRGAACALEPGRLSISLAERRSGRSAIMRPRLSLVRRWQSSPRRLDCRLKPRRALNRHRRRAAAPAAVIIQARRYQHGTMRGARHLERSIQARLRVRPGSAQRQHLL